MRTRFVAAGWVTAGLIWAAQAFGASLPDSLGPVSPGPGTPFPIESTVLDASERAQRSDIELALKLRHSDELKFRLARGERISAAEMEARYAPLAADRSRVAAWVAAQGLVIDDANGPTAIFAHGTVDQVSGAFATTFARVGSPDGSFISALTAPVVPDELAPLLVGVNGLQPHLHARRQLVFGPAYLNGQNGPPFLPSQIVGAYGGSGVPQSGTGQTIAIVIDTFPKSSDLTAFWTSCSVPQSLANLAEIQVVGGTLPAPSGEETLDTEWSSSIAPGASIRVYATVDLSFVHIDQAYARIYSDLASYPSLQQLSLSYGAGETYVAKSQMETDDEYFEELAAGGVTVCVASGDGGSSPGENGQNHSGPVQTETPASDYFVTAVGGTSLTVNGTSGAETSESAWYGSGGGYSQVFAQPAWQSNTGFSTAARLVPDVASAADPNSGAYIVLNGQGYEVGGTSWAAPTWAGYCALINQARQASGASSLGLAGPSLYPLLGASALRDITTGDNGANNLYDAGAGFDLCTGLGVAVLSNLIPALIPAPIVIVSQPGSQTTSIGAAVQFSVQASGTLPAYQWQVSTDGGNTWTDLVDGSPYSGSLTATLTLSPVSSQMNGYEYRCAVTNADGTVVSAAAELIVPGSDADAPVMSPPALAALAAACLALGAWQLKSPKRNVPRR